MKLMYESGEEKLYFKNKKHLTLIKQIFLSEGLNLKQDLNLISRSASFFVIKSYFVVNSFIAKPERLALSKMGTSILGFSNGITIINNS